MASMSESFMFLHSISETTLSFNVLGWICLSDKSSVSLYEVKTRQFQKKWVIKQGSHFTSPVSFSQLEKKFLIVQNNKVVRIWDHDDSDINLSKKIKFSLPIYSILSTDSATFAIFENGSIQSILSEEKEVQDYNISTEEFLTTGERIKWNDICVSKDDVFILLIIHNETTRKVTLHSVKCSKNNSVGHKSLDLNATGGHFHNFCIMKGAKNHLVYPDIEGNLYKLQIENLEHLYVCSRIDLSADASLAVINENYLLIADQQLCKIWNLDFHVEAARQSIPYDLEKHGLLVTDEFVFAKCTDGIIGFEYKVQSSTLASFVGKDISQVKPKKFPLFTWEESSHQQKEDSQMEWDNDVQNSVESSSRSAAKMIENSFKNNDLEELGKFFKNPMLISESDIVDIMDFVLNYKKKSSDSENMGSSTEPSNPLTATESTFINQILNLPFNDIILTKKLRSLQLNTVLQLLNYLLYLMMTYEDRASSEKLSLQTIVDWVSILLDSHFNKVILTPDPAVIALLSSLNTKVLEEYTNCKDFVQLDRQISSMKEKCALPKVQTNSECYIQILEL